MPSHRKRIGFLPSKEVHDIIEKICFENKLSQSKVTGILVEEALINMGVLKKNNHSCENYFILKKYSVNTKEEISNNLINGFQISDTNNKDPKDEIKMINDFIEYKFFKEIMNKNNDRYR